MLYQNPFPSLINYEGKLICGVTQYILDDWPFSIVHNTLSGLSGIWVKNRFLFSILIL